MIRIVRNENGNCINFVGTSMPAYFNACLSGEVDSSNDELVSVVNDVQTATTGTKKYEFFQIHFTEWEDRDGNTFSNSQEVADYITANGNVVGIGETGRDLVGIDVNFRLDDTHTSVIMSNGFSFGVNTIQAVPHTDGTVHINAVGTGNPSDGSDANTKQHFLGLEVGRVLVNDQVVAGGINTVCNKLNELFTVGPFEAVVITDPFSTMIADVDGVAAAGGLVGSGAVDPAGSDIGSNTGTHNNNAGWLATDSIDQAGEYYTFDIRGEGQIGFGLVLDDAADVNGNATYGDPASFCNGVNNSHYGYQFSHFFHQTPNGPWTNYGANTSYVQGPGWYSSTLRFPVSDEGADWLAGNPVKMKVGLDTNGYVSIEYYDASEGLWVVCARSGYPIADGVSLNLGIKFSRTSARLFSAPKIHLLESAAPVMNFRYIESPDGNFHYPLFSTAEEAEYYDQNHDGTTGTGTYISSVFPDDPSGTSWFQPDTGYTDNGSSAPSGVTFQSNSINWTEITSLSDSDLVPPAFSGPDYTFAEDDSVGIQVSAQDVSYTTTVSGLPSGLSLSGGYLISGTTRHVFGDQTYTIVVTRTNSYGSSSGTFDITVTDDVAQNAIPGYSIHGQNPITQTPDLIHHYSGAVNLDLDLTLNPGTELTWTQLNSSPVGGQGQYLQIGVATSGVDKSTTQLGNTNAGWDLKCTIWTNSLNHNWATGWVSNASQSFSTNNGSDWRLAFPTDNGPIELYRDGVLVATSAMNFTGNQTVTAAVPVAYSTSTRMPSVTRSDITFTGDPPAGFTQTSGSMLDANTLGDNSVVTLDSVLEPGKRMIVNKSWVEANVLPNIPDSLKKAYVAVPSPSAAWGSVDLHLDFDAVMRWEGTNSTDSHKSTLADGSDTVARHEGSIGSSTNAYYHYAIQWDGTDLVVMSDTDMSKLTGTNDYSQMNRYSAYESYGEQSGDLPLVMATKSSGSLTLKMSGISFIDIPAAPVSIVTPWTKAIDFSGSAERMQQEGGGTSARNTLYLPNGVTVPEHGTDPALTSNHTDARPWATAIVFKVDGHSSNQHIWNHGEGQNGDNIYLRMNSAGHLYFGWGIDGGNNECKIVDDPLDTNRWYGVYVAHRGPRFTSGDATASNLASAFDIYVTDSVEEFGSFPDGNRSISSQWTATGNRMNRSIKGNTFLGGRDANRSFHGKVASFVLTSLKLGEAMPDEAEALMMVMDPKKWLTDYKIGNTWRQTGASWSNANFQVGDIGCARATQVWLMGDRTNEPYAVMRNQVMTSDQNETAIRMVSMVSNDIQTVNISGLTS